jgi:hypothetical protein
METAQSSTQETAPSSNATSQPNSSSQSKGQTQRAQDSKSVATQTKEVASQAGPTAPSDDEYEEIKIGSASGKVPKALAKTIKDLERGVKAKFQEASQVQKRMAQIEEAIKSNPRAVLKHYGVDPEEFAEATLAEKIEMLTMSPEQKRLKELEEENKRYKEYEQKSKEQQEKEKYAKEEADHRQSIDLEIADAWKDVKDELPADTYYVKQIAALMRDSTMMAMNKQIERPLTAKQAAAIVKQRFENTIPSIITKLSPERMMKLIGEQNFSRMREWDLNRITDKAAPTPNSHPRPDAKSTSVRKEASPKGPMSEDQWTDWWNS